MEITLLHGLLISLAVFIIALDYEMEGFFIFRPIIVAPIIGAILGDLNTGLKAGSLVELAFAGITQVGGVTPPDPVITSVMTVVIAKSTNADVSAAFALAYPFGVLNQTVRTLLGTGYAFLNKKADKYAESGNLKAIYKMATVALFVSAIVSATIAFLSSFAAQESLRLLVEKMPEWLLHGFGIAGGLIPAIGFAMLLRVILKGRYVAYLMAGFLFATFIPLTNILPVAIMGLAFALIQYYNSNDTKKGGNENGI